jgi:hypothetical protein
LSELPIHANGNPVLGEKIFTYLNTDDEKLSYEDKKLTFESIGPPPKLFKFCLQCQNLGHLWEH